VRLSKAGRIDNAQSLLILEDTGELVWRIGRFFCRIWTHRAAAFSAWLCFQRVAAGLDAANRAPPMGIRDE
jgi:hypothetical protein